MRVTLTPIFPARRMAPARQPMLSAATRFASNTHAALGYPAMDSSEMHNLPDTCWVKPRQVKFIVRSPGDHYAIDLAHTMADDIQKFQEANSDKTRTYIIRPDRVSKTFIAAGQGNATVSAVRRAMEFLQLKGIIQVAIDTANRNRLMSVIQPGNGLAPQLPLFMPTTEFAQVTVDMARHLNDLSASDILPRTATLVKAMPGTSTSTVRQGWQALEYLGAIRSEWPADDITTQHPVRTIRNRTMLSRISKIRLVPELIDSVSQYR